MHNKKLKNSKLLTALLGAGLSVLSLNISAKSMGPEIQSLMVDAAAQDIFEVIVTFEGKGKPRADQIDILESAGVTSGASLNQLPMVGIKATKAQIESIYANDDVRSIYHNAQLSYENDAATQMTGVDKLRADQSMRNLGMPYSGRGIGVVVNDSGIDASHGDIKYPNHVVQNVLGQSNLNNFHGILPISYLEDVTNTDNAGGHGSHVAGIIGGNGSMSGGKYEGVAPGAKIIGYGSGAGILVLGSLGGFDYALTHQYEYNIRVISNSFGNPGDTGTDFDPDNPTNIATKELSDRGIIVVFSAGNSGSGEATITGNIKKAPWLITVANGDVYGNLADTSSRGENGRGGEVVIDGETFIWEDRPTITAPGTDIVSVRASTGGTSQARWASDRNYMDDNHLPFYTTASGTSMSAPHVAGVVAMMLEANPNLTWKEVKKIIQDTATSMPGLAAWEVGAGYINAYAAVNKAADLNQEFGKNTKLNRLKNASVNTSKQLEETRSLTFSPVGENTPITFMVKEKASLVFARAKLTENTVGISLTSPSGKRYSSGIAIPVLGPAIGVSAPAEVGEWTVEPYGVGGVSGVALDPARVTNGYAVPETFDVHLKVIQTDGFVGIDDVVDHPARGFVEYAVTKELIDAKADGFKPDEALTRADLATYFTYGGGVRQSNKVDNAQFNDVDGAITAVVNDVTESGSALRNTTQDQAPVMLAEGDFFYPNDAVSKTEAAYSLIQSQALQTEAEAFSGDVTAIFNNERIVLVDQDLIPEQMKGYVQLALDLGILSVRFDVQQGPYDLEPTITATFNGNSVLSRADFAVAVTRFINVYR